MKILIAEDDRATRLRIQALLSQWGHDVIAATNGLEAWELFDREQPQLILTDWLMPRLDGLGLVDRIRKKHGGPGGYAYVIMLTSRSETADLVKGIEAGADDFITKPFASDELRARIRAGVRIVELEQTLENRNRTLAAANVEISEANRRMKRELEAVARIQNDFLPVEFPATDRARFAWHFEPCEKLSGDALNILPLDDHRVGLYMIDVSGHGVAAALRSVHVNRLLTQADEPEPAVRRDLDLGHHNGSGNGNGNRQDLLSLVSPASVVAQLNERFPSDLPNGGENENFFTMLYGILDLETRTFDYTSAGHPGPILVPANRERNALIFEADPPAVGFFKDALFRQQSVSLEAGDRFYLYTGGVLDVRNEQGESFGELRLADQLEAQRDAPLDQSLHQVIGATREWDYRPLPNNDISLLGVEVA